MGLAGMHHDRTTRMPIVSLSKAKSSPGRDWCGQVEHCARRYRGEEVRVEGGHTRGVVEARDYTEDDGYKYDGIFKAGTVVNRRRMLVDKEEGHSQRDARPLASPCIATPIQ